MRYNPAPRRDPAPSTMKIAILLAYFALLIAIGFWCRRKAASVDGFVLGGRTVGPWLTAFAYGTSYFSAVVFVGYAGQFGWRYGISATWAGIGNALIGSLLAWAVLGRRTRIMTQHLDSATMPDFFAKRFGSPSLKLAASAIIFVFLIPYTASLYNGLSRLFSMAFPGFSYSACIVVMAVLTAVYVIAGGYLATAINDFIQGIVMLFGIAAIILAVLASKGGLMAAMAGLARETAEIPNGDVPGIFTSFLGPDPLNLLFVVILTSLGTWGLPQMVQKFYAIKNEGSIKKGTLISTLFAFAIAGGCYFLGGFGRLFSAEIGVAPNGAPAQGFDSVVPKMLESAISPDGLLMALVVVLVLSASMSTLSSLVITSSSTLTIDFIRGTLVKDMKPKSQVLCIRVLLVVFIAISAALALVQYNSTSPIAFIAQMMGVSWGAMAGAFLAPFLYSLYSKKVTAASCWACFILAPAFTLVGVFCRDAMPGILKSPINTGALAMLGGLVIVPIVNLFTRKPPKELVDGAFACYEKTTVVQQATALGAETIR